MAGLFIFVTQIVWPLVAFKTQDEISKPVSSSVLGIASGFSEFSFSELEREYSPVVSDVAEIANVPEFFYLTVPKLGIKDALVQTNSPDLSPDDWLGHYIGSALPGEVGNTFIYGHSVLPFFYNPRNYKTIFSTLHTLNIGDTFTINYNNKELNYVVEEKKDLLPKDVYPLAEWKPRYLNESTVVLMTCSPPGTKLRRLLVQATLTN
ncbi:MAG: sortase [Patescibacteria group bacterium]